ncbi:MAG: glycosyltransferase family 39 protein [Planctomycetaceae bacterium]|nr:glycosyltransferase family 39 protein [Planctomycetaceae bacterium]
MPLTPNALDLDCQSRAASRAFWLLAALHLALWTLTPLAAQPVAPLDMVEMRYWGHQWQLGYHKHPPLPGWIAETACTLCGGKFFGVYLASQLGIVACLWAVWRLGREVVSPWLAFLAACLVETSYWYTMGSVEYNNNVGMFPFWALAILFLYWALTRRDAQLRWWIATGAMLGLAMLCKYSAALLAMTVFLFLVAHPMARHSWRGAGPYLMISVAVLLFTPHFVWAVAHGFPTLDYAASRAHSGPAPLGYVLCPLVFIASQLAVLMPTALALTPVAGFRWRLRDFHKTERFARDFLLAMTLGPLVIQTAYSALFNKWLLSTYGSQFWMYAGLTLLYCLALRPNDRTIRRTWLACAATGGLFLMASAAHSIGTPYVTGQPLRIHCPAPTLGATLHQVWRQRYHTPLPVIAGDWWLAANAAFYGPRIPLIYGSSDLNHVDMCPRSSGWTDDEHLGKYGGIIIWNAGGCDPRDEIRRRFPTVDVLAPISVPWETRAKVRPLRIGVAVVPPR